jgi:hypothetical protein
MAQITFETKISPTTGEEVEYVFIELSDGGFSSMEKKYYDELEAAKENGTIS